MLETDFFVEDWWSGVYWVLLKGYNGTNALVEASERALNDGTRAFSAWS